ncbi:gamma carbonic anhydrase family protein [Thorsellia kenyensis]|uniref:Gamma carbonic anhydrase family protein n=1 Tax=Thorsellia kenyensis TaxID=1549888 RepID=A0ABV6C6Q1_9GAMM
MPNDPLRSYKTFYPKLTETTYVDPSAVVIGDVTLAEDVSIWPLVVIRGDVNSIDIGQRTNIQDGSVLHVTHRSLDAPEGNPLIIKDNVTIGHKVILHGCTIESHVLIGMGTIILDGAVIESEVIVGAGSLVTSNKRLESGFLYMGQPVKKIRPLTQDEIKHLSYSADNYVKWKNDYLISKK